MVPHKDAVDLIENNLVTRVGAQRKFHIECEKSFLPLRQINSLFEEFDHGSD